MKLLGGLIAKGSASTPAVSALPMSLDGLPPTERAAVHVALLQHYQQRPTVGGLVVLLYSIRVALAPVLRRHARAGYADGIVAEVFIAAERCAARVDTGGPADEVETRFVQDVGNELRTTRRAARHARVALSKAGAKAAHTEALLAEGALTLHDLFEPSPESTAAEFAEVDTSEEEAVLSALVEEKLVTARDAELLARVYLRNETVAVVAAAMGLRFDAAEKALTRVRRLLMENRARILGHGEAHGERNPGRPKNR